ncbi:MAG TPA: AbrB/MazE/SpoVT family DNA-binding domain-containing protein [Candidatus Dormibacteraeota bacterium]|nr:AbrB/MazE/SpoVT family DNA-binding domain-containing protein [Candidatus Dormibacteraeota bacterium]HEX2681833.1 AbrB/MazE/SpoVT family DNA-binding domain-containing protein [Candidatus Dormibacteraeota bacterium]
MSPNGRVTLPAETRRALGLKGESLFEVHHTGGSIVLRPVAVVPLEKTRSRTPKKRAN